jgi:acetoin utilization deacetylase AcuC-like enzyme
MIQVVYSPKCLEYKKWNHPESPERVRGVFEILARNNFKFLEPELISENDLLLVHSQSLIDQVKDGKISDPDTPNIKGIFNYALLSVSGAVTAMQMALKNKPAFSLMRPPGHHAGKDFLGGFCYFNNLAVAVAKALRLVERVAILDIDCHHGNGTEDIFLGRLNVLYVSLHESPLYPGTGLESRLNCLNFPLLPKTGEDKYLETLAKSLKEINNFKPNLLAISAGFDTLKKDPLTYFGLEVESYQKIGQMIGELKIPTFAVLEGGYSSDLPKCVLGFLQGLAQSLGDQP